mmetsp:Transcript_30785/g.73824  ORF Transcript_30785/g.73824 Transcript_30785/m.73824 type:complete len:390 (-) Transcript_30785:226-1395(-)
MDFADSQTFLTAFPLKANSKAQEKQQERRRLIESVPEWGPKIMELHQGLQDIAGQLDKKVENMLEAHEKDFFEAYREHICTVQREFKQLQQKADEEETKTRRDAKIKSLKAELDWFQEETLRLNECCQKYKKELDKWRGKAEALDDDRQFLEDQIKTAKKQNTTLRGAVEKAQTNAYTALVSSVGNRDTKMLTGPEELSTQMPTGPTTYRTPGSGEGTRREMLEDYAPEDEGFLSVELEQRYVQTIASLKKQIQGERRTAQNLREARSMQSGPQSEIEEYFIKCVEQVKTEINDRRLRALNDGLAVPRAHKQRASGMVKLTTDDLKLDDFTAADRRKVIGFLLSNEEVLVYLYEKLFPHRQAGADETGSVGEEFQPGQDTMGDTIYPQQ